MDQPTSQVEAVQAAPPEIEDGGQTTIDHLREINLGATDDLKPIFVSTMLNDEEVVQYEQLLQGVQRCILLGISRHVRLRSECRCP